MPRIIEAEVAQGQLTTPLPAEVTGKVLVAILTPEEWQELATGKIEPTKALILATKGGDMDLVGLGDMF